MCLAGGCTGGPFAGQNATKRTCQDLRRRARRGYLARPTWRNAKKDKSVHHVLLISSPRRRTPPAREGHLKDMWKNESRGTRSHFNLSYLAFASEC